MEQEAAQVVKLLRQQAAIASFGSFALRQTELLKVLTEAARVCADGLGVAFSKVCRYRVAENDLLVEAGYGWQAGVVGNVVSRADRSSPQGRAFITGQPSICNDLRRDNDFELPRFYADHGIISTIDVIIKGNGHPYGVLEIDNNEQHDYDQHDINFLTGFANVLAEAVGTSVRVATLQTTIDQMKGLLSQKNVLAEELQHRVRNNLQLVYGMLSQQMDADDGQRGIAAIARRVFTLAQVYDHLGGAEMTRTTDFGIYLKSLCEQIGAFHDTADDRVKLICESDSIMLDLDVVTALGIIVTELVTNSLDHAFPNGIGTTSVSMRKSPSGDEAILFIGDTGPGFKPDASTKRHGLGLVRRLVAQVGGEASLNSNHGAAWTIRLPLKAVGTATEDLLAPAWPTRLQTFTGP